MTRLLAIFFGCQHHRTTRPMTTPGRTCYVACLACGAEFSYSWNQMRQGGAVSAPSMDRPSPVAGLADLSTESATGTAQ